MKALLVLSLVLSFSAEVFAGEVYLWAPQIQPALQDSDGCYSVAEGLRSEATDLIGQSVKKNPLALGDRNAEYNLIYTEDGSMCRILMNNGANDFSVRWLRAEPLLGCECWINE